MTSKRYLQHSNFYIIGDYFVVPLRINAVSCRFILGEPQVIMLILHWNLGALSILNSHFLNIMILLDTKTAAKGLKVLSGLVC